MAHGTCSRCELPTRTVLCEGCLRDCDEAAARLSLELGQRAPIQIWGVRDGRDEPLSSHFDEEDAALVAAEYAESYDVVTTLRNGLVIDRWERRV